MTGSIRAKALLGFEAAIFIIAFTLAACIFTGSPALADEGARTLMAGRADLAEQASGVDMHRLYNRWSGEHFYTGSSAEKDHLVKVGWRYEGTGWVAPSTSKTPVYRLYNPYAGDHHYTTSAAERDGLKRVGWRDEGTGWYSDDSKKIAVWRQYNPHVNPNAWHNNAGSHNFTTSKGENDQLARAGWRAEGVGWYAIGGGKTVPNTDPDPNQLRARLNITTSFRASFNHGFKGADWQGYIVLHDTEGDTAPMNVVNGWDNGAGVAAHFVIGKDGSVVQCVDMSRIAHHAGYGDTGHNRAYRTVDESRDDKRGTVPIGSWAADYGMNSYSIGIELVHVGGSGYYPEAQLRALDNLIAYIDAYYGFTSPIIDHKMWRTGNSDTSPEFSGYLANYQRIRRHA